MTDLENPLTLVHLHRLFFPEEKRDAKIAAAAEAQVQQPLAMLNRVLSDTGYLLDARFTVADLNVACVLSQSRLSAIDVSSFPQIAAWAERCHGRPALKDVHAMRAAAS